MTVQNRKILAIAPYSKQIGVAVFESDTLTYFTLKPINSPRTESNIRTQVKYLSQDLLKRFEPHLVVIKAKQTSTQPLTHFEIACSVLIQEVLRRKLALKFILLTDAKKFLCPNKKTNEINVFTTLCREYPEITQFVNRPTKDQKKYYTPLLVAVMIGFYQLSKLCNDKAE